MSSIVFRLFLIMVLLPCGMQGQEYSYTRYDIRDGLAGSMVYCMLQDKQGFLWFGTETGVSRFDGTNFKNFTTADGLSDNQVLELFEDSKGRIWMSPFNKSICYYYKGKIYNQQNDPFLQKLKLAGYVANVAEDKHGNILLMQTKRVHLLKPSGDMLVLNASAPAPDLFHAAGPGEAGDFELIEGNRLFELHGDSLVFKERLLFPYYGVRFVLLRKNFKVWRTGTFTFAYRHGREREEISFKMDGALKFSIIRDSLISVNTPNGAYVYNRHTKKGEQYLPNETVSTVFQDNEHNLWFCTLGHGIFRLNSRYIRNISLLHPSGAKLGAYIVKKYNNEWLVGSDMLKIFLVNEKGARQVFSFGDFLPERIITFVFPSSGNLIVGTDSRIMELDSKFNFRKYNLYLPIKDFFDNKNNSEIYVASSRNALKLDVLRYQVTDTLWNDRATSIFSFRDTSYVGTLDGLFIVPPNGIPIDAGSTIPQLRNRIMAFRQSADSTIWIATYSGVHGFKDGRLVAGITETMGLASNVCRALAIFGNELWVGTNKGLQKIDISNPVQPKPGLILSTELSSEIINYVDVDRSTVAVATSEGINLFDKEMISFNAGAALYMDNVIVSGRSIAWDGGPIHLASNDNNIRFEFAGISYRSGRAMRYEYRLIGLDSTWKETREGYLDYPTLPGGEYRFEIQAINKFGARSQLLSLPFGIEKKLWQKTWFQVLAIIVTIVGVWLLLSWRVRAIRRQESEKNNIRKKIASLEQLALKSQMNPHFVFNSLNSIQLYVLDKDIEGANKFITGFSRLIRQTLDISTRQEISIAEETSYLSTYLQLEKIRLENKFEFEVTVDPSIDPDEVFIPPMILQPFVENCVRHGIRYRQDSDGKISIAFKKSDSFLDCEIEDNGVGRKLALSQKSLNPIEYQSKGISLTTDRIELMNKHMSQPISFQIYDLEDGNGKGTGTRVIISFPLQQTDYLE